MNASNGEVSEASAKAGSSKTAQDRERYDWERLEFAVRALVEQQEGLRNVCDSLRGELGGRDDKIRLLEAQLLEANQLRQDTAKRIDELISQLDQLDEQLAGLEPAASG